MITAMVDHGTRSISNAYRRDMNPYQMVEIPGSLASLGWKGILALRREIISAAKQADMVLCLHHGGLIAAALLLPKRRGLRQCAVLDWTRAFPSLRQDRYIKFYNPIFNRLMKRFDALGAPARKFCDFYQKTHGVAVRETLYPLPYPEQLSQPLRTNEVPRLLFIGADFQRKAGDVLLDRWAERKPPGRQLTFVCPNPPETCLKDVDFLTHIQAGTPEHLEILQSHDVFVFPSRREAFGYAALEALNFGQVVVTTRQAGIAQLVEEAGGIIGETPEEVVDLAFQLAADPNEVRRRRERIRQFMSGYPARLEADLDFLRGH
jgi:hypothetical protein